MRLFKRPIYAGNAIATVKCMAPIKIITVRGTAFSLAEVSNGNVETEEIICWNRFRQDNFYETGSQ